MGAVIAQCTIYNPAQPGSEIPEWLRDYLMKRRQVLLMELGQIEDMLGLERSVTPRRKQGK